MKEELQRCGFCGRFFKGLHFLTLEEIQQIPFKEMEQVTLGYCPDAQGEQGEEPERHRVTRDMAIDAGDPSLEGTLI